MPTTYIDAVDEINKVFWDAWSASSGLVGYVPEVYWQFIEKSQKPDSTKFWCRFSVKHIYEKQRTISSCETENGKTMFESSGLVVVSIYGPKSKSNVDTGMRYLATVARNAFRDKGSKGDVWFKNTRIHEVVPEDLYYKINVLSDFSYTLIGG
ncbi:MAG: hypothetical protein KDB30_04800 [Tetrasphaera sp.]|nr:hypothetical protein [Tetrasphaera sp.]